jgi:hypothetical protein
VAILLDTTTKGEYDALTLASARASLVVSALSGTVVVEVYDGLDVLRASGTMAAPWATSSGATITVGEVTGLGLLVTSGGAPTAEWYCQFRSGTRFVRGTFGVAGSGRDFVWSLASFQANSRGTLGTVAITATGDGIAPSNLPLLYEANVTASGRYLGAFRVPFVQATANAGSDGGAIGFNPAGDEGAGSLFMRINDTPNNVIEMSIPTPRTGAVSGLNIAALLQGAADPFEGQIGEVNNNGSSSNVEIMGLYAEGSHLYSVAANFYDADGRMVASHFRGGINLATAGDVLGAAKVDFTVSSGWGWTGFSTAQIPRWTGGPICPIPTAWQSSFGGTHLTGIAGLSINSAYSNGPCAAAFNLADLTGSGTIQSTLVVGYPYLPGSPPDDGQPLVLDLPAPGQSSSQWNRTARVRGMCFPLGYRSVLFFGKIGTGPFTYGVTGQLDSLGSGLTIVDPSFNGQGDHAYPYRYKVWAYDANDLAAVKNGTLAPHAVSPYSEWFVDLPYEDLTGNHSLAAAFDPVALRLYLQAPGQDTIGQNPRPVIHVFQVA